MPYAATTMCMSLYVRERERKGGPERIYLVCWIKQVSCLSDDFHTIVRLRNGKNSCGMKQTLVTFGKWSAVNNVNSESFFLVYSEYL